MSGKLEGRQVGSDETARDDFLAGWFARFPTKLGSGPNDFKPTAEAPFVGAGKLSADAPADRSGIARKGDVDLGPIEVP